MSLEAYQRALKEALVSGEPARAAAFVRDDGLAAEERLRIHCNTFALQLVDVLATTFPAVRALVGEAFFDQEARAFIRSEPPQSPILALYGQGFPDHLAGCAGLAKRPYLADVARLEAALASASQHQAVQPLAPEVFARIDPDSLADLRLVFQPALRLLPSHWPVAELLTWARQGGSGPAPDLASGPEIALVRPAQSAAIISTWPWAAGTFLALLVKGRSLGSAAAETLADHPDLSLTDALRRLIEDGLAVGLIPDTEGDK
ncbi:MAG: putative DNA-binding domain-containing protein [Rhodospirillales bacterium]